MRGYKIVRNCDQWCFQFIPNNSKRQPIGESKVYSSYDECVHGIDQFRKAVIGYRIDSVESPYVKIVESGREAFIEYIVDGEMIFQSRKYSSSSPKSLCKNCAVSIYNYIDAYTLKQVF